jgi:hypothetical protein
VGPLCRLIHSHGIYSISFPVGRKKNGNNNNEHTVAVISGILYFCRTDRMPHSLAFIQTYTLHVLTVGGGKEYTLRVHTSGGGKGYTLHVYTAGGGKEYTQHQNIGSRTVSNDYGSETLVHTAGGGKEYTQHVILLAGERFILAV